MTLTRPTFLSTSFLLHCLCWLVLGAGLVLPAAARTHRVHALHHRHLRRHIYISRMLPTIIPIAREGFTTVLRGRASWYSRRFQGRRTTSGERYNRHEYTCAHKTLPFGTRLRVTNLNTGASVVVRVTDRGPFRHQRIMDLSEVAARPLGIVEAGAVTVVAEIVSAATPLGVAETPDNLAALRGSDPHPEAPFTAYQLAQPAAAAPAALAASAAPTTEAASASQPAPHFVVQAGTFADAANARAVQAHILSLDQTLPAQVVTEVIDGRTLSRVIIGQLDSWLAAETVRRNLQLWGVAGLVRQVSSPVNDVTAATGSSIASAAPVAVTALQH
ncbi:septal ring lytic transglycosylase RlpA family protein [Hymenobacter baengnokdamensis]|uniref:septal ring lytic transglycosylase RlpA family protein n=1 Tax=Hymenobacter baengnokdamensis TaxID=2615203 RepID=UPI001245F002|nr:septal ring lytic transglycosylase RlpA family protein [Hymenobacter baengnokdamensis]